MQLHGVDIGKVHTKNNLFLAPLAGYTNAVFRKTCLKLGASLAFTEMVSAKGLVYSSEKTADLLKLPRDYAAINACQIFGKEPEIIKRAVESDYLAPFDIIDINMGCPVPKIYKNGEGCALMENIPLACQIVKAAKSSGKAVSVKFRTGLTDDKPLTRDFAVAMQDAGADMLTIHGRSREKIYAGAVNYDEIAAAKSAVQIPVIANGGVFTPKDAEILLDRTGADGVTVARGAMFNPFLFAEITGVPVPDKKAVVCEQLEETYGEYGERFATVYMRKMIGFYVKGKRGAAELRVKLMECKSKEEISKILEDIEF